MIFRPSVLAQQKSWIHFTSIAELTPVIIKLGRRQLYTEPWLYHITDIFRVA